MPAQCEHQESHLAIEQLLSGARGIGIGDHHNEPLLMDYLVHSMPEFARMGVRHLYLEAGWFRDRAIFEAYYNGEPGSDAALRKALLEGWGNDRAWRPHEIDVMMGLIASARDAGICVLPIDYDRKAHDFDANNRVWADTIRAHYLPRLGEGEHFMVLAGKNHYGTADGLEKLLNTPVVAYDYSPSVVNISYRRTSQITADPNTPNHYLLKLWHSVRDVLHSQLKTLEADNGPNDVFYDRVHAGLQQLITANDKLHQALGSEKPNPVIVAKHRQDFVNGLAMYAHSGSARELAQEVLAANDEAIARFTGQRFTQIQR